jgi:hypothetical protein
VRSWPIWSPTAPTSRRRHTTGEQTYQSTLLCRAVQLNSYFRPTGSACDAPRRLCCCLAQRLDITRFGAGRMLSCRAAAAPAVVCVCVPSRVRTPMATGFANTDCSGTLYFGQASMRLAGAAGATVHCALYVVGCLLPAACCMQGSMVFVGCMANAGSASSHGCPSVARCTLLRCRLAGGR